MSANNVTHLFPTNTKSANEQEVEVPDYKSLIDDLTDEYVMQLLIVMSKYAPVAEAAKDPRAIADLVLVQEAIRGFMLRFNGINHPFHGWAELMTENVDIAGDDVSAQKIHLLKNFYKEFHIEEFELDEPEE